MSIIIFTATREEAVPIISRLKNTKKISSGNLKGWQGFFDKNIRVQLFGTGIGVKKIDVPVDNNPIIINIGIAGSLSNQFKIGEWFAVSKVSNINCNFVDELKTATLVTTEAENLRGKFNADLVDMEGLTVAKFAKKHNLKCYIFKMVSDFANENSSADYKKSMELYYKTCFEKLQILIKNAIKRNID